MDALPGGNTRGYIKHCADVRARLMTPPRRAVAPQPEPEPVEEIVDARPDWSTPTVTEMDDAPVVERRTCRYIFEHVATFYGVSLIDMASKRKEARIVWPRKIAYYLARKLTLKSLPEIGRRLGGKDHTSVLHGARKIEEELRINAALQREITELTRRIEAGEPVAVGRSTTLPAPPRHSPKGKATTYQFWTPERKAALTRMWFEGVPTKLIAYQLGRSVTTIGERARMMNLPRRHTPDWRAGVREEPFS